MRELVSRLSCICLFILHALIFCRFFSSSWCRGLAAASDCSTPWTLLLPCLSDWLFLQSCRRRHYLSSIAGFVSTMTTVFAPVIPVSKVESWFSQLFSSHPFPSVHVISIGSVVAHFLFTPSHFALWYFETIRNERRGGRIDIDSLSLVPTIYLYTIPLVSL